MLAIMFRPFGFLAPKDLYIIWFSDSLVSSVPDEGYSFLLSTYMH